MNAVAISPATGRRYGVDRVCGSRGGFRSSNNLGRKPFNLTDSDLAGIGPGTRILVRADDVPNKLLGFEPEVSHKDTQMDFWAYMIGLRWRRACRGKAHSRRKFDELEAGWKRALLILHENRSLSSHRKRPTPVSQHDGNIVTGILVEIRAIDGAADPTTRARFAQVFGVVGRWIGNLMGFYVNRSGTKAKMRRVSVKTTYEPCGQWKCFGEAL